MASIKVRTVCIIILSLLLIIPSMMGRAHIPYERYSNMSVKELYDKASAYEQSQKFDSALACYAICGMKYDQSLSRGDLELTVNAMRREAQIYFYTYYEYETACNRLAQAHSLCKYHNLDKILPQIIMQQAGVYYTYATQNPDDVLFRRSENLYKEAFDKGYQIKDYNVMANTFANVVSQFQAYDRLPELKAMMDKFGATVAHDTSNRYLYSILIYRGAKEILAGHNAKARAVFLTDDTVNLIPRHRFKLTVSAIRTYLAENKLDSAIALEHRLLALCEKENLKDGKAIVLRDLGNLYNAIGDSVSGHKYAMLGLQSKDTLINVNHLDKAANMSFLEEMHKLHDDVANGKKLSETKTVIIIVLVIAIFAGVVIEIKIHRRNRRAMANAVAALEALKKKQEQERADADGESMERDKRYQTSNMDAYTCAVLTERIQKLLTQDNKAIFVKGFSIDDVAKTVKSNSKYVSQIINQTYGCNFSTLISTIRAQEVAKRISDPENYGNMTFEAIGASVGFGSRAAFNAAFKRLTGKTPREYRASVVKTDE